MPVARVPATPARSRTVGPLVLAAVALCFLAAWFISGLAGDGGGSRPGDARPPAGNPATSAVPTGGIPAPLDDALSDLQELVQ